MSDNLSSENLQRTEIPYFDPGDGQKANELVLSFLNATSIRDYRSSKNEFTDKPVNEGLWTMEAASNYMVNQNLTLVTDSVLSYNFELNTYKSEDNIEMLAATDMVNSFEDLFRYLDEQSIALACEPKIVDIARAGSSTSGNGTYNLIASVAYGCESSDDENGDSTDCTPNWVTTTDFLIEVPNVLNQEINKCFIECDETNTTNEVQICDWYGSVTLFDIGFGGISTFDLDYMPCFNDYGGCLYLDYSGTPTWTPEIFDYETQRVLYVADWFMENANSLDPDYFSLFDAALLQSVVNGYESEIKELGVNSDAVFPGGSTWYFLTLSRMILGKGYAY